MNDLHDDLAFWDQIRNDSKRTILCAPDKLEYVKGIVARHDKLGQFSVKPSRAVSGDMLIVVDENAFQALTNEAMVHPIKFEPRGGFDKDLAACRLRAHYGFAAGVAPTGRLIRVAGDGVPPTPLPARRSWIRRAAATVAKPFRSNWWRKR